MNPMFAATLAIAALSVAEATIIIGGTVATTAAGVTTVTVGSGALLSSAILGGLVLLKGLALGAIVAGAGRSSKHRRSAEDNQDAAFTVLNNAEPAQCYRRLICDMAAGAIPDQDKILSLFNTEVSPVSPKFDYVSAAKVGKLVKNAGLCEVRYSCPLSTAEISKIFA